jgi:hypothetical protein
MDAKVCCGIHHCGAITNCRAKSHRFRMCDKDLKVNANSVQISMISVTEQNVVSVVSECYFVLTVGVTI